MEAALHKYNRVTKNYDYQAWRRADVFAAQVISEWDFTEESNPSLLVPISEEGIGRLRPHLGRNLVNTIWVRFNEDPESFRQVVRRPVTGVDSPE